MEIIESFIILFKNGLVTDIGATLTRVLISLLIASLTAVPTGIILGTEKKLDIYSRPLVYTLYTVPKISLYPLAILLFGLNNTAGIAVMCLVLFFQILIAVRDNTLKIKNEYRLSIISLGAGKKDIIKYLIIPSILPGYFTALRIGIASAIAVAFFTESVDSSSPGLGNIVMGSWAKIDYPAMTAGIITTALLGFSLYYLIGRLEKYILKWRNC